MTLYRADSETPQTIGPATPQNADSDTVPTNRSATPDKADSDTASEAELDLPHSPADDNDMLYEDPSVNICTRPTIPAFHTPDQPEEENETQDELPPNCSSCGGMQNVVWCHLCDVNVCTACWNEQAAHKKPGSRHQQTTLEDHTKRNLILGDVINPKGRDAHVADYCSKWFGVNIKENESVLNTTTRFQELARASGSRDEQYPALISFLGDTGAGKSSLITALVKVGEL
jgi:hypothetical protein